MDVAETGGASPPPYDPLLPAPSVDHLRRTRTNQITPNTHPVSMDTPTETPHDLFCLAKEYERRGRMPDAANLYLKASMNGHLSAMVSYASQLVATDERAAFVWLRAAAERGDARAWAELGQLLARGRYFEVNAIDAARCWKRAAQMGDNAGKSALGLCYIRGFGVKQDADKGIEIVRQVADIHNDVTAMKNLAWIYRHGKGADRNLDEAEYWDARAKKQEKLMTHISTREHLLFGRARLSRHGRQKQQQQRHQHQSAQHERESDSGAAHRSKAPVLEESDLHNRLRAVSDDPARRTTGLQLPAEEQPPAPPQEEQLQQSEKRLVDNTPPVIAVERKEAPPPTQGVSEHLYSGRPMEMARSSKDTISSNPIPDENNVHIKRRNPLIAQGSFLTGASTTVADALPSALSPAHYPVAEQTLPPNEHSAQELAPVPLLVPESELPTSEFGLGPDEIQAVHLTAEKAAVQAASATSPPYKHRVTDRVASPKHPPVRPLDSTEHTPEDTFITPDQSLDNEEDNSSSLLKPAIAGFAAASGAGVGLHALTKSGDIEEQSFEERSAGELHTTHINPVPHSGGLGEDPPASAKKIIGPDPETLLDVDPVLSNSSATGVQNSSQHPLAPVVRSRALFFENSAVAEDPSGDSEMRRGNSYALNPSATPGGASGHVPDDLDEFEQADMQRMASESSSTHPTYTADAPVPCKITRASMFSKGTKGGVSQRLYDTDNDGGFGGDPPTHSNLRDLLALFPENPMRSDSQVPLFNLLNTIQRFAVSDTEAYSILEQGNGFAKIVVAMLSQHEDEFLQEQGMHAFVRVLRTTPSSQRENLVLLSYADCYRKAQGNPDVVIPKGSLAIDERSSGVIQAIVKSMRYHSSIRRVQLAGCAGLGEVAAVSPSCRSIAYEHGAITLIVSCLRHRSNQAACTIHDIACRAISNFCSGKDSFALKEAFASAGTVTELLNVLQLWGHADDVTSELLTTATKNCCLALRHITDSCTLASEQCVQSYAYHHLVRVMVLRRNDVSVCTIVVSAMAAITRNAGAIAEKGLQDAKPLPEVLVTMQSHSEQPLFIRKCLDFMEALGNFVTMKEEIVLAGGIPFAAGIVQQGGNDSLLLERACGVVEKLCRSNPKNQEIFASNGGILSLTALLGTHQALPGVVERALLSLTSTCANNNKTQKEAVKVGAPDQVMRSLGTYSTKNSKVVAAATSTMAAMVVPRNATLAQSFAKLKAPELVVRAMKRHPDSVMVQENGSAAIASFCEADPRVIAMLLKSGISSILVVGLQRFLHKQSAVVQIVRAMRALSNEASEDSYRFKSKLLTDRSNESSLSEIFHTALSYHKKGLPETANVIISICATINRLCMRSVAFKNEVGKDGIVEELKKLVEKTAEFKDLGALQPVLATICTLVLDSEDNKNRFHAVGGVEAVLDVMQKWKSDTYVLEHCCAALRYSCNDHFGNCDEVKNHNGVRSVLGVMELHPENVNVTLWCCLTLADLCKGDEELQSSPNVVQGIRKVVSAMSMFSSNSRFLASACEFLRAASVDNEDNQERIVRLGGRTAIVKAMESHPHDQTLTESGAYALLQVQDVQDANTSVDSQPQIGLVKRLSRDLRRSGSSSNRSNRSSGKVGLLGRKTRSFSVRRKPVAAEIGEEGKDLPQTIEEETTGGRPALLNFSRGSRRRLRKAKSGNAAAVAVEEPEEGEITVEENDEELGRGAQDGYEEANALGTSEREAEPQIH